ncbi:MAG: hypothetical protein KGI27_14710 [Thaumarchaeota archaeon]|nr:hypothetical protein [Nitrososphaerota archaeon]
MTIGDIYALLRYGKINATNDLEIKLALHKGLEENKTRLLDTINYLK